MTVKRCRLNSHRNIDGLIILCAARLPGAKNEGIDILPSFDAVVKRLAIQGEAHEVVEVWIRIPHIERGIG